MQVFDATYIDLDDEGRVICQDCYPSAVLDMNAYECLVRKCHKFFESLNMQIPMDYDYIPFFLVDTPGMMQLCSVVNGFQQSSHATICGVTKYKREPPVVTVSIVFFFFFFFEIKYYL